MSALVGLFASDPDAPAGSYRDPVKEKLGKDHCACS